MNINISAGTGRGVNRARAELTARRRVNRNRMWLYGVPAAIVAGVPFVFVSWPWFFAALAAGYLAGMAVSGLLLGRSAAVDRFELYPDMLVACRRNIALRYEDMVRVYRGLEAPRPGVLLGIVRIVNPVLHQYVEIARGTGLCVVMRDGRHMFINLVNYEQGRELYDRFLEMNAEIAVINRYPLARTDQRMAGWPRWHALIR